MFDKGDLKRRGLITTGYHLPYNPKLKERARELRKNMTKAEKRLWYGLLRNLKYNVLRQKPIDNYIVDFYCPRLRLVIEVDGDAHSKEEAKVYDEKRTAVLEGYRLKVLRFMNYDVLKSFEGVCQKINDEIIGR
jgi:very-short-patch-repair endonuclease